jgi:hypothetical protein
MVVTEPAPGDSGFQNVVRQHMAEAPNIADLPKRHSRQQAGKHYLPVFVGQGTRCDRHAFHDRLLDTKRERRDPR